MPWTELTRPVFIEVVQNIRVLCLVFFFFIFKFSSSLLIILCSVQSSSVAQSCPTLCDPMNCSMPDLPVHCQLLEFTRTHIHWVGDAIQPSHPLCHPLLLLPSIFPSIRVFSTESVLLHIRWTKYRSFSFSISPSEEYPGLISFRMDWLDLLVVQGTLESLLQHPSSKASILRCSAFFIVQLSHPYMTTGKTIALTRWTLLVMSLLLICCLGWHSFSSEEQAFFTFMAAVTIWSDFEAPQNKVCHCFLFFPPLIPLILCSLWSL